MKAFFICSISLILSGCASQQISTWEPYSPESERGSETSYQRDLKICRFYSQDYLAKNNSINPSQIGQEGLSSGLAQVPNVPALPIAPALGGLSGASVEALDELGVTTRSAKKVFAWCMHDKGLKDGFSTWDPNL